MSLGRMNALGASEMNVLSAGKVNTLSLPYVFSRISCIFSLILSMVNHLDTLLSFSSSVPYNIDMLAILIPNNIPMLAKAQ